jgi:hypothetical protein
MEAIMEQRYYLCSGPGKKDYFSLPSGWEVTDFVESPPPEVAPVAEMALNALTKPAGVKPLRELCAGARSIAVIIDDATRPTPVAQILGVLLPHLVDTGIEKERVTIVIALGTHVPLDGKALENRVGKEVVAAYRIVQHDARQADLVPVAIPGDARKLKANPVVARADLKIGVSSILPHPMAGFGGGPKILMPGVCDFDFIMDHHMRLTVHPNAKTGVTKGNPFHEDCMKVAHAIGLDFSINCVYDQQGEIVGIIGGGLESAFDAATAVCAQKLGHRFDSKVDVTITSTYPHTHGHQFAKGLSAPDVITRETGAILMAAPLVQPVPDFFTASFKAVTGRCAGADPAAFIRETMSAGRPFLPDKAVEFNMAMSCFFLRPRIRTVLASSMVSREEAAAMGLEHAPTLAEGLGRLAASYPKAKVAVLPSGGLVIPTLDGRH